MDTIAINLRLSQPTKDFLSRRARLLIGGKWVDAASGKTFPVYNPATDTILAQVAEADKEDVNRAVAAARKAFDKGPWRSMPGAERGKLMWKLAALIEQNLDEFAELESVDNGKPLAVARVADVPLTIDMFRYMGGWATKITGETIPLVGARSIPVLQLARAGRRCRPDHSMELPAAHGSVETRARLLRQAAPSC